MQRSKQSTVAVESANGSVGRHVALDLRGGPDRQTQSESRPDDATAELSGQTHKVGNREIYVLARKAPEVTEMPVFPAGPDHHEDEAIVVFTVRELGTLYLQVTDWDDYEIRHIAALALPELVHQLNEQQVRFIMINPNRNDQQRGEPQPLFHIDHLRDPGSEDIFSELMERGS